MKEDNETIGKRKLHFRQIDSTNAEAKRLIESGQKSVGILITADYQTLGRGQYGRNWESEVGQNVIMSVVLAPVFLKLRDQFLLNVFVSMAVAKVVGSICESVHVKWPNDIYVEQSKIAGILIQNFIQGTTIKHSIVGIGLNVNQSIWPSSINNATSLSAESNKNYTISNIVNMICEQMNNCYDMLRLSPKSLLQEYESRLFRKNEDALYSKNDIPFSGIIRGVDEEGRLIIEQDGVRISYMHGEIQYVIK